MCQMWTLTVNTRVCTTQEIRIWLFHLILKSQVFMPALKQYLSAHWNFFKTESAYSVHSSNFWHKHNAIFSGLHNMTINSCPVNISHMCITPYHIIIIICHGLGLNRPVWALSNSLCKSLPSCLHPFWPIHRSFAPRVS